MLDEEKIRTVVGIIGNVISLGLFLSPLPTFVKIWKEKAVNEFKPDPYLATLLNCAMWAFYGLPIVHPDSFLVITINGAGFVIELIFIGIFFTFAPRPKRKKIIIVLVIEAVLVVAIAIITIQFFHSTNQRSFVIGILCILFTIIMYASPLTVMRMVIKTKSVKYMPFFLSFANLCNGVVWATYALFKFDPYILVPNVLGTISGLVQLILYATYYKSTNWDSDEEEKPQSQFQIQLSNA